LKRKSLYFVAPQRVELREEELSAPGAGELQIEAICSAISAGTEMLLYRGEAPSDLPADASLPALRGSLAYPLKYGYCAVGRVAAVGDGVDEAWKGRHVFAFNPHENTFNARAEDAQPVPAAIADEDAAFLPNMETAVNLILDGDPRLGERVVVLGQGVVGLLATALLARHPLDALLSFDRYALRREFAAKFGAQNSFDPDGGSQEALRLLGDRRADLVYELSGRPQALDLALSLVGDNGRIVVGSWYGQQQSSVDLGGHFHRGRIKIISSQVSHIEPALTGRWDRTRRFELAWKTLAEIRPSQLVTNRFPFEQAHQAYARLAAKPAETLGVLFDY
jgi:2-desacetyl-2-hydroxyethyl bacteriochlorophyllide A dehydrogenase